MAAFWTLLGAFLGIAGKSFVDLKLANRKKLPEQKLKWSVECLAAAGRAAQAVATWCNWQQELRHKVAVDPDEHTVDERGRLTERTAERRARAQRARVHAYKARGTVRLLVPDLASDAPDYLELSVTDLEVETDDARPRQIGASVRPSLPQRSSPFFR